jgi:hypothetical protein
MKKAGSLGITYPECRGWLIKFGYSDSNEVKRFFMIRGSELRWGMDMSDSKYLSVKLNELIGISLGQETTTFKRMVNSRESFYPWCCFSLIFVGRTLDLSTIEGCATTWILALQEAASQHGATLLAPFTKFDLTRRVVIMKIRAKADGMGKSLVIHLRDTLHACLSNKSCKPNICEGSMYGTGHSHPQSLSNDLQGLRKELSMIRASVADFKSIPIEYSSLLREIISYLPRQSNSHSDNIQSLQNEITVLRDERRNLVNEIMELKGSIRVFVRVRPLLREESDESDVPTVTTHLDRVSVFTEHDARTKTFEFDEVLGSQTNQERVFRTVDPFIASFMNGYNVCIFAYGVTNSGKTYTMEGNDANPGLVSSAVKKVLNERPKGVALTLSVTQIYNEEVHDLLNGGVQVDLKVAGEGFRLLKNREFEVNSWDEASDLIREAGLLRATNITKLNALSSRSHCIYTFTMRCSSESRKVLSKLNLIDLAGSENVNRSGATGGVLKEAQTINKSLSALGDVVHALIEAKKLKKSSSHIPFRNSKLTMMLKDSLQGNSKVLMIVQVSPRQSDVIESLGSLQFGSRVRTIELGKPLRSSQAD